MKEGYPNGNYLSDFLNPNHSLFIASAARQSDVPRKKRDRSAALAMTHQKNTGIGAIRVVILFNQMRPFYLRWRLNRCT
ncbi:MAG: hypothetical protein ACI9KN_001277 [Gammaproteobacteria bacterium]|jgi:hypothetical protein